MAQIHERLAYSEYKMASRPIQLWDGWMRELYQEFYAAALTSNSKLS
jgi:hypothetical protein